MLDEEGIYTVYIIGKARRSNVEVIPQVISMSMKKMRKILIFVDEDDCLHQRMILMKDDVI